VALAPVSITGSVQSTIIGRRGTDGTSELTVQEGLGIGVSSYIWQPWFVQVRGDTNIVHDKVFGDEGGSSISGSANMTLAVLPQSNYPVNLGFTHFDSRASGEFAGTDFTRDRVFIDSRAVLTQNLRGGLSASWERADQADSGVQTTQTMNLNLNQTFPHDKAPLGITSVGLNVGLRNSDLTATDPDEEDGSNQVATLRLDTHSEPFENLFFDSLLTAIYDDDVDGDDATTRKSLQGISTAQWRPEGKPFIVTGTLRTLTEKIEREDNGESSDSDTKLAAATLGLRWPVDDNLSFNLGLRGSYEDVSRDEGSELGQDAIDDGQRFDAVLIADVNYISDKRKFASYDWRWDARASTESGMRSDEGVVSRESAGVGHRFERMFEDLIFVPVLFSFAQGADLSIDANSDEPLSAGISDSITFSYSGGEAASSTFARLFFSDTRDLIGENNEFQMIQGRIGRRVALSRQRRLQGDLSAQAARQVTDGDSDIFVTAFGNFAYDHRDLFDIENLGWRSELRVNAVNLEKLFGQGSQRQNDELLRNDWRNVLSYRIGRLVASLEATAFQREAGFGYLALMRFRRVFGGGE
jgi:hypothetical protein